MSEATVTVEHLRDGVTAVAVDHRSSTLARASHVLVALDFDGVLAPLGDDPMGVRMVDGAREVLDEIAASDGLSLALVSGRPAADLVALAGAPVGTLVAASHGAQRGVVTDDGLEIEAVVLTGAEQALLARLGDDLGAIAAGTPNAWVEEKPLARVLHTRTAEPALALGATQAAVDGPAALAGVHAIVGKSVVELAVRDVTKADGVAWARERTAERAGLDDASRVAVVFAGDDTTDEHALADLGDGDVGIKVGDGDTHAVVRVADEAALVAYLRALVL